MARKSAVDGTWAISTQNLRREFITGKGIRRRGVTTTALDNMDLAIAVGEIHGLLGPNGAGKTTLCKILSTVLLPTSGTATVAGSDVVSEVGQVRRRMGIVFGGDHGLYRRLTARRNLRYWGALHRLTTRETNERAELLLERVGLVDVTDERVETFSRGMKQRLHLARGLMSDPEVLLLDEPTTGMDPVAARDFRAMAKELHGEGRTRAGRVCHRTTAA